MTVPLTKGPFCRLLDVRSVPDAGLETSIEATSEECTAVAKAMRLPGVDALGAEFKIGRRSGGRLQIDGTARAKLTQTCVVSLESFESEIEAPIDVMFAPSSRRARPSAEKASRRRAPQIESREAVAAPPAAEEDDPPDPIIDDRIDLGAVAVEFLTLGLDLYPRKPGARFREADAGETQPGPSAFADLARFKDRS